MFFKAKTNNKYSFMELAFITPMYRLLCHSLVRSENN